MAKKESVQKRLEKVRPPRVQLTYDVEIGDAIEKKELPFVVGVLGFRFGEESQAGVERSAHGLATARPDSLADPSHRQGLHPVRLGDEVVEREVAKLLCLLKATR